MIGQKLGSFLIEAEIGAGAMGVVYRGVRDTGKTRVAAVKVIGVEQMAKGKAFERFVREAEILEQFRHPNIVRYLARGKSGKTFYYAMEFIPGRTLDGLIEEGGALPWEEVARMGVQICDALQYAHEHSVVHRDLKPSNLMVTIDGDIKLTDFGIAKDLDATALTATGRTMGTAAYMAPEQIRGTPEVSHKTDLYALGIVFYQMLTGELPFQGTSAVVLMHCQMNEPAPRASAKTQVIPVALDELVHKLMAKAPTDRPWDAAAVGVTLRELLEKHEKGQPIPMVWPEVGSAASNPTRGHATQAPAKKPGKKKKKKNETAMERLRDLAPAMGLVAALLVVGGADRLRRLAAVGGVSLQPGRAADELGATRGLAAGAVDVPRRARAAVPRPSVQGPDRPVVRPPGPDLGRAAVGGAGEVGGARLQEGRGPGREPLRRRLPRGRGRAEAVRRPGCRPPLARDGREPGEGQHPRRPRLAPARPQEGGPGRDGDPGAGRDDRRAARPGQPA